MNMEHRFTNRETTHLARDDDVLNAAAFVLDVLLVIIRESIGHHLVKECLGVGVVVEHHLTRGQWAVGVVLASIPVRAMGVVGACASTARTWDWFDLSFFAV